MRRRQIEINAALCLECFDIINSTHVHCFVICKCKKIFIDGGLEYLRYGVFDENFNFIYRISNEEEYKELLNLSVTERKIKQYKKFIYKNESQMRNV